MSWEAHPILTILCVAIIAYFGWKMRVWHHELCRRSPIMRWLTIVICSTCVFYLIFIMIWGAAR
jgi:hypothetical protein